MNYPAFVAETAGGQLLGMLTYVPGQDWRQCEILTLHAGEQWHGAGTALIEAAGHGGRLRDPVARRDLAREAAVSIDAMRTTGRTAPPAGGFQFALGTSSIAARWARAPIEGATAGCGLTLCPEVAIFHDEPVGPESRQ
jgi:hypothetical protein